MAKIRSLLLLPVLIALLVLPVFEANGQDFIKYEVAINGDGSAAWKITQASDVNASIDTYEGFQQKVLDLVDSAAATTQRGMTVDLNSLQIETVISSESKTTEYTFIWQNFSFIQNGDIVFGDVFHVPDFFVRLYGDASLQITFPSAFTLKAVSPEPSQRDNQTQALLWYRTQDFVGGNPSVTLTNGTSTGGDGNNSGGNENNGILQLVLIVGGVSVAAVVAVAVFLFFRRRKSKLKTSNGTAAGAPLVESDEEKIVNILKSAGGSTRQSVITEQSKFSKAKTSQLLAVLEQKGVVTRVKKGRDKIVTLNNNHNRR